MRTIYITLLLGMFATTAFAQQKFSPKQEAIKQLNRQKAALEKKV